jgi:hypothetical protein
MSPSAHFTYGLLNKNIGWWVLYRQAAPGIVGVVAARERQKQQQTQNKG